MTDLSEPMDVSADDKAAIAADDKKEELNGVINGAAASNTSTHTKTRSRKSSTEEAKDKALSVVETVEGAVITPSGAWPPPIYINARATAQERFYIEHRWHAQWEWYDKRATFFKKRYQRIQLGIGIGSGVVPALIAFTPADVTVASTLRIITIAISLIVTALTVWENVYKHGDNWRTFRAAAEDLGREKTLYDMGAGHYKKVKRPFQRFTERCEDIIAKQNGQWLQQQEQQLTTEEQKQPGTTTEKDEKDENP